MPMCLLYIGLPVALLGTVLKPSLISGNMCPLSSLCPLRLILYPPFHPILPHLMSLQLFLNFFPWGGICIPAGGENVIHPTEVKPWVMWRTGGGKKEIFNATLHGNVKFNITCLSDSRFELIMFVLESISGISSSLKKKFSPD